MDAAKALILHYGYDKTTMSDIARETGVSKGALYLHYDSKEALFDALFWRETDEYVEHWLQRIEDDLEDGTFIGMYKNVMHVMAEMPLLQAVLKGDERILGSFKNRRGGFVAARQALRWEFIEQMQTIGGFRADLDPKVVVHFFNIISYGMLTVQDALPAEDQPPLEHTINLIAEVLERAFVPEGGGNREAVTALLTRLIQAYRTQGGNDE